ncbi:hypothetical protein E2C01_099807 [Portunus trituberculatus]|uniref:Uncharacterized protein n=1 Tax=Portunus trituberculatus TaxID=210409 RepID=A0A5B7KBN7_PORTR|nr:hypothetical protein [Portunus trituberculatus]
MDDTDNKEEEKEEKIKERKRRKLTLEKNKKKKEQDQEKQEQEHQDRPMTPGVPQGAISGWVSLSFGHRVLGTRKMDQEAGLSD